VIGVLTDNDGAYGMIIGVSEGVEYILHRGEYGNTGMKIFTFKKFPKLNIVFLFRLGRHQTVPAVAEFKHNITSLGYLFFIIHKNKEKSIKIVIDKWKKRGYDKLNKLYAKEVRTEWIIREVTA